MINRTYTVCTKKRLVSELYDKIVQSVFTDGIISDIIKDTTNRGEFNKYRNRSHIGGVLGKIVD